MEWLIFGGDTDNFSKHIKIILNFYSASDSIFNLDYQNNNRLYRILQQTIQRLKQLGVKKFSDLKSAIVNRLQMNANHKQHIVLPAKRLLSLCLSVVVQIYSKPFVVLRIVTCFFSNTKIDTFAYVEKHHFNGTY